jgi:hypothetical protein
MMPDESVPLGSVIRALRSEITEAIQAGEHESIRFELGLIEVELNFTVAKETGVDGEAKLGIRGYFGASAGGRKVDSNEHVQKIKFTLKAISADPAKSPLDLDSLLKGILPDPMIVPTSKSNVFSPFWTLRHPFPGGKVILELDHNLPSGIFKGEAPT